MARVDTPGRVPAACVASVPRDCTIGRCKRHPSPLNTESQRFTFIVSMLPGVCCDSSALRSTTSTPTHCGMSAIASLMTSSLSLCCVYSCAILLLALVSTPVVWLGVPPSGAHSRGRCGLEGFAFAFCSLVNLPPLPGTVPIHVIMD